MLLSALLKKSKINLRKEGRLLFKIRISILLDREKSSAIENYMDFRYKFHFCLDIIT